MAHGISFALSKAQKVVRGLWKGLTDEERWNVACRTVEHLKEHGDKWKLNEELESPVVDAQSTPRSFTEAHNQKAGSVAITGDDRPGSICSPSRTAEKAANLTSTKARAHCRWGAE